jgi:hypothetical protein
MTHHNILTNYSANQMWYTGLLELLEQSYYLALKKKTWDPTPPHSFHSPKDPFACLNLKLQECKMQNKLQKLEL